MVARTEIFVVVKIAGIISIILLRCMMQSTSFHANSRILTIASSRTSLKVISPPNLVIIILILLAASFITYITINQSLKLSTY